MKRVVIVSFVASCVAALAFGAAAETPGDFAYRLPLTLQGDRAFHRVDLPADVYRRALRPDLGDLRVLAGDGTPVAFAFLPPAPLQTERPPAVTLPVFPLRIEAQRAGFGDVSIRVRKDAGATTVDLSTRDGTPVEGTRVAGYLVDTGELRQPLTALSIPLAGESVNTRLRVEGSDDLTSWRLLGTGPLLRLEMDGRQLLRNHVDVAPFAGKYLRLTFDASQPVIDVPGVAVEFANRVVDAPRQWLEVDGAPVADRPGVYDFDLGGTFPVDRLEVVLPELNTVAPARVLARAAANVDWRTVDNTVLYRLRQEGGEATAPAIAVGTAPARWWRLEIDARSGGVGQGVPRLRAGWSPQVLVFAARGQGPFELAYGSARVQPAALPIASLVPGFERATMTAETFARAIPAPVALAGAGDALLPPTDTRRWALWASLVVAVLVLGGMAWKLTREMSAPPRNANDRAPPGGGA